jgi:FlaA1/EpsC-like NDP-sugar epimerase
MLERDSSANAVEPLLKHLVDSTYYTKRFILVAADTTILTFALWASVSLRLEEFWPYVWDQFAWLFLAVPLLSLPLFIRMGMYRAVIRYTGLEALWVIFIACFSSSLLMAALLLIAGHIGFPRSVPLIYFFFSFILIGGSRLAFRNFYARFYAPKSLAKRVLYRLPEFVRIRTVLFC